MNLIIFGGPGSGKGTQAAKLIQDFEIAHISTGDILRAAVKAGTELGKTAQRYMNDGKLVPDEIVVGIIEERIEEDDCKGGFLLDGFPRTLPQAEALQAMMTKKGINVDHVIQLDVPDEEIMQRLLKRAEIEGRADDNSATIKSRLEVFHTQTSPLVEYYKQQGVLRHIPGLGTIDEIYARINSAVS